MILSGATPLVFFYRFQFQLIQSLICWFPLGLPQNWSRTHLAIIEKNSKRRHPTYQILQTMRWVKTPTLNGRTEKFPAKQRTEKAPANERMKKAPTKERTGKARAKQRTEKASAKKRTGKVPAKECTVRAPAKEATGKAPAKECIEKPLRNSAGEKPLRKSARINLFKVTDTLELPLGSKMRRKRKPALDIS